MNSISRYNAFKAKIRQSWKISETKCCTKINKNKNVGIWRNYEINDGKLSENC